MKKIIVVLGCLLLINSCVFVGFSKGPFYQNLGNFKTYKKNENVVLDLDDQIHVELPKYACGYYGVIAMIVPVLPYWKNAECKNLFLGVSQVSKVYIRHN
ncbi:MAG: hypothetical protein EBV82_09030, partial [Chitinophagia bacterium]|nr:hypothetical protein [Chitinophagia bacterium]